MKCAINLMGFLRFDGHEVHNLGTIKLLKICVRIMQSVTLCTRLTINQFNPVDLWILVQGKQG